MGRSMFRFSFSLSSNSLSLAFSKKMLISASPLSSKNQDEVACYMDSKSVSGPPVHGF